MKKRVSIKFKEITVHSVRPGECVEGFYMGVNEDGHPRFRSPDNGPFEAVISSSVLRRALKRIPWRKVWMRVQVVGIEELPGGRKLMKVNCQAGPAPHGARGRLRRMGWRL